MYKSIIIEKDVFDLIERCKEEFVKDNPKFEKIKISNNKIMFEVMNFYLNN